MMVWYSLGTPLRYAYAARRCAGESFPCVCCPAAARVCRPAAHEPARPHRRLVRSTALNRPSSAAAACLQPAVVSRGRTASTAAAALAVLRGCSLRYYLVVLRGCSLRYYLMSDRRGARGSCTSFEADEHKGYGRRHAPQSYTVACLNPSQSYRRKRSCVASDLIRLVRPALRQRCAAAPHGGGVRAYWLHAALWRAARQVCGAADRGARACAAILHLGAAGVSRGARVPPDQPAQWALRGTAAANALSHTTLP